MIGVVTFYWRNESFRAVYEPRHVDTLYAMVKRHMSERFRFYCLTNDMGAEFRSGVEKISIADCPTFRFEKVGSWPCLNLFNPEIQKQIPCDRILKLDLDCVIVRDLSPLLSFYIEDRITGWLDISHNILNPSFALIRNGFGHSVWESLTEKADHVESMIGSGHADKYGWDQAWLNYCISEDRKKFLTKETGIFHRRECDRGGTLPTKARIVYFNSSHKPWHEKMQLYYPWIRAHYK